MSSKKCARCDKTVYPIEELKCLDKLWHKTCFKCYECGMTLNMKSYKGFNKLPYCNAHCPVARATTVVDTPETRRLAENTKIQSQVRYHEDFEKQKGKLTQVADDPETLRIRNASKIISNATYHGEYEKKKQMEERRNMLEGDNNNVLVYKPEKTAKTAQSYPPAVEQYPSNNNIVQPVPKNVNNPIDFQPRNQYSAYGNNGNPIEPTRNDYYKMSNVQQSTKLSQTGVHVQNDNYQNDPRYVHSQVPPQMAAQHYHHQPQVMYQAQPPQQQPQPVYHDNRYYSGGVPAQNVKAYSGANLGKCFRAIYDYTAQDVDEVSFQDGDLIINCQAIDDGWMTGTVQRTMLTGMLPSNYVESA